MAASMTGPVTLESIAGTAGTSGYFRSPVTLTFTPYEAGYMTSQLSTYYRVDNGPLVRGNSVTLTGDGFHNVAYVSFDPAGRHGVPADQFIAIDRTPPTVTAFASPSTLWPPNHKFDAVTVTGHVADNLSGDGSLVYYAVIDSEGQDQPSGQAAVDSHGNYSFVVDLQASRLGQDKNGRLYTIYVFAFDRAGNLGAGATYVFVPHDQGKH